MQGAQVIIPPWNIHHLQSESLQRQLHGLNFDVYA